MLFHQFGDPVRRWQVIGVHHHVHVDKHLLAEHPAAGDVVAVEYPRNFHRDLVNGFRGNGDLINQLGQVGAQHRPAHPHQQQAQRNR